MASRINYNDLSALGKGKLFLLAWKSTFGRVIIPLVNRKEYVMSSRDALIKLINNVAYEVSFETYETILLEYPYATNCKDYVRNGLSSRKDCREKCIKSKTTQRFGYIFADSYAFPSDILPLANASNTYSLLPENIIQQCRLHCLEIECHTITYFTEKDNEQNLGDSGNALQDRGKK